MKKLMQNSKAAAAANNIHTHPLKGGGVIFAACSTRENGGLTTKTQVRESRNVSNPRVEAEAADGTSHPAARMPRISPQTALPRVESPRTYSDRDAAYAREYEAWMKSILPERRIHRSNHLHLPLQRLRHLLGAVPATAIPQQGRGVLFGGQTRTPHGLRRGEIPRRFGRIRRLTHPPKRKRDC